MPKHQPWNRKKPTALEEKKLRSLCSEVNRYLDFAFNPTQKVGQKHRFIRQLYGLYQKPETKRSGCFYIKDKGAKKVVLCESAIDAISYFVIHRKCLAVSTSGANPSPYWLTHFINHGFEIFCAFDSDETGERTAMCERKWF